VTPEAILKLRIPRLRTCGLSAAKAKTLKELAKTIQKGLRLTSLRAVSPEEATEKLVAIWGIGPWTAEMFLLFGLGHEDIFSPGDLGLVRSMEDLYGLKKPSREALIKIAEKWSPHRSLASRILWRHRDT
jgi:DNA-3-methyladenine glycosylase II